jgi:hypothetical protein
MARAFHVKMHIPQRMLDSPWEQRQVYGPIGAALGPFGGTFEFVLHNRETALDEIAADGDFHIFERGKIQHPRALNCGSAYIAPYQYLDSVGTRYLSSIGQRVFDASTIEAAAALQFQNDLCAAYGAERKSRYEQPSERLEIPAACIAVFLQSETHRDVGEALYISMRKIIKALLARDDPRAIVVKPHPRDMDFDTLAWLIQKSRKDARLYILPANIHDILAVASVVVTINSAVGIEAMMYNLPIITCGQADFHHATEVVRDPNDLDSAILRAAQKNWHHAEYLYWFYRCNCISMKSPTLGQDVLDRITATGYFDKGSRQSSADG